MWFGGGGWDGAPVLVLSPRAGLTPPAVTGVPEFFKPLEANSSSCLVLPDPCRQRRLEVQEGMPRVPSGRGRGAARDTSPGEVPGVGEGCDKALWDAVCPRLGTWGAR